ncbi:carbohydrate ABC transporter permease [Nonomuraea guangzhouensis]|uniref:Carbohydrate ABC transporter permease n=1 Tax=Nonomuraea guangzhouensis TaxID=1291555 RepID=A0ABW4GPT4_9ACTN|nr:sugar ABC transporter permease [Nonomuraea guangzhouensis]
MTASAAPRLDRDQARAGKLFVAPAMVLFVIFNALPVLGALALSFTDYDILTPPSWAGLGNYTRLFDDDTFITSLKNIVGYCLMFVPLMIVLSLLLALALNSRLPGMTIFRTIYFIPVVTSPVAAATVWAWMLNGHYGVINEALRLIGIDGPAWLGDPGTAMISIVLVTLWQGVGSNMLIYLAGLQGVPDYLYEAAALDGAGRWRSFLHITWPSLRTTTFFVTTLSLIGAFQLFDQAYVMTKGGPGQATLTPVYQIYETGFNRLQMGYASAQAFSLFLVIVAVTVINLRVNREETVE